jgi:nucleoside-diphosphate-sugar epimerase
VVSRLDLRQATIGVTGATGFIGRYLVRALEERGARVIAVVRNPQNLEPGVAEARQADLSDPTALTRAFEGCDAVVCNAGMVSIGRESRERLRRTNVEGTRNVFLALRRAKVPRAIVMSSATVYARKRGRVYVESDPLWSDSARLPRPYYYAWSKAVAEREAWSLAGEHGIQLTVVRPSGVYGAFDRTGFTSWMLRFAGLPGLTVFPTHLYIPNVYAADLAEAVVTMLERPVSVGKAYNVAGDPEISFWEMLQAYRLAGGKIPRIVVPFPIPMRYVYDLRRAREDLGFKNRPPIEAFGDMLNLQQLRSR